MAGYPSQLAANVAAARGSTGRSIQPAAAAQQPMIQSVTDIILQPDISTRLGEGRDLTLDDYRYDCVVLKATIGTTSTTGLSGQDTFIVPPDQNFLVTDVRGYFAFTLPSQEALAIATLGNLGIQDRILLKAMNTQLALQIVDRSLKLFDNHNLTLAAILPMCGGSAIDMRVCPHMVPAGSQLQLSVNVYDSTSSIIGQPTDVGVIMSGYLVRLAR